MSTASHYNWRLLLMTCQFLIGGHLFSTEWVSQAENRMYGYVFPWQRRFQALSSFASPVSQGHKGE